MASCMSILSLSRAALSSDDRQSSTSWDLMRERLIRHHIMAVASVGMHAAKTQQELGLTAGVAYICLGCKPLLGVNPSLFIRLRLVHTDVWHLGDHVRSIVMGGWH